METIIKINDFVNGIVWGVPIMLLILGTGVYYTVRLGFIQFRHPVWLVKQTIVKAFQKKDEGPTAPGELTSFQAAMTSVSAIVGSGNIAGAATAIVMGGPGALIWMILAAFVGMATKFAEIALGIKYRKVHEDGTVSGGAMYYLSEGLHPEKVEKFIDALEASSHDPAWQAASPIKQPLTDIEKIRELMAKRGYGK